MTRSRNAGPSTPSNHPTRILVVDDLRDAADSLAALLGRRGHVALACYDGPSALEMCRRRMPDVVLLDLGMPEFDGLKVAAELRGMQGGEHVRLIAVTGWMRKRDVDAALAAGFDHYLVKPVTVDSLEPMLSAKL